MKKNIIIIGNGMVGYKFCERLNEKLKKENLNEKYNIVVFAEELIPAYDRVHLSQYITNKNAEKLSLASPDWYKERKITLNLGDKIIDIDRKNKVVYSEKGLEIIYDKLIFATGSNPFVPPIKGKEKKGIFVYRTLNDLDNIRAYAKNSRRCAVIGGGLLGLEAAKAAQDLGMETFVVEFANRLMPRQLDNNAGAILKKIIELKGIKVLLSKQTISFEGKNKVEQIIFSDDSNLKVDIVIISAGIRPRDDLGKKIGLNIGERGGIEVNDFLQTSDKNIFAVGECALFRKMIYGLVAPGYQMAEIVCHNLFNDEKLTFDEPDMSTKLKLIGTDVCSFGQIEINNPEEETEIIIENNLENVYKKLLVSLSKKTLLGGILVGDGSEYHNLLQLYKNESPLPKEVISLISPNTKAEKISLPMTAQVCSCENVSKETLCKAIKNGCQSIDDLKKATKAGTGCGGCLPLVENILKEQLANSGEKFNESLCEHFKYKRVELFEIIKKEKIKSFKVLLKKHGKGLGCEVCKPAVASIFSSLWNDLVLEQREILDTNDTYLANIQKNGTYSVVPRVAGGEITPEQLIVLGQVAKEFNLYTKITGGQRIDLFGARLEQLPDIWEKLIAVGFETGQAYAKSLRTVKSCVGLTWCRYGVQDSTALAIKLENRYKGIRSPHKLKSAVSGCTRECAEAQSKDFGVIATEKGWNLYVCGNGGMKPRHADLLATDLSEETLIKYIDRFLIYYIKTADKLTRTSVWLESLEGGIEHLKEVIIQDKLGICEELEQQMKHLISTYQCEWKNTVEDPNKRKLFKPFINTKEQDESINFVEERKQIKPA